MGKSECISLVFPAATISRAPTTPLARTYSCTIPTLAHLCLRRCASATPLAHNRPATLAHLRLRRCASATPLAHNRPIAPTHPRLHRCAQATPLSRTFVLHLYTLAPPLRNFVLPSLFRSLSESIRIYPSLSDILREISMGPD